MLNECEEFRRERGDLLRATKRLVVQHYRARPEGVVFIGDGLGCSPDGHDPEPRMGPTVAGRMVMRLALGVAIFSTDWTEWVGVGGGERS